MDRNRQCWRIASTASVSLSARRAWIEIFSHAIIILVLKRSLSARRAWIEILSRTRAESEIEVALRKESVDRNIFSCYYNTRIEESLSARRAWIEIDCRKGQADCSTSLSARRAWIEIMYGALPAKIKTQSLSARRAWIEMAAVIYS